jgi:hypothetical protein
MPASSRTTRRRTPDRVASEEDWDAKSSHPNVAKSAGEGKGAGETYFVLMTITPSAPAAP